MAVLDQLEPKKMFRFFEEICQIPHGTFDIGQISDYCADFAKKRNLEVIQDEVGNAVIKKPGTPGYENSAPVILQGHMDMVCDKRPESTHDFKKDPLKLRIVDGSIMATDTTLGADNGVAVAMVMAILDSDDIPHPPLEVLFTVDEETGMGGATAIDMSLFKGRMLINMDSEDEGIFTAGCAGGTGAGMTMESSCVMRSSSGSSPFNSARIRSRTNSNAARFFLAMGSAGFCGIFSGSIGVPLRQMR